MKPCFRKFAFIFIAISLPLLFVGCVNLLTPLEKNEEGYYSGHYNGCGPAALEKALREFGEDHSREQLSKSIQDSGNFVRELLAICDTDAVHLTMPSEIKKTVKKYGYELISVKEFESLNPEKDIAIILVRGKLLSKEYHWACYPVDIKTISSFYGENTKIVSIYLMKKIK